jgi:uncharacterized protein (TIGR02246 family)
MGLTDIELRAIVAVQRLMARYVQAVDAGDPDAIAALFAPTARMEGFVSVPVVDGREAIRQFFVDYQQRREPGLRHHITSIDAGFEDDGVLRATSYLHVIGGAQLIAGVYRDEFVPDGSDWLFAKRVVRVEIPRPVAAS